MRFRPGPMEQCCHCKFCGRAIQQMAQSGNTHCNGQRERPSEHAAKHISATCHSRTLHSLLYRVARWRYDATVHRDTDGNSATETATANRSGEPTRSSRYNHATVSDSFFAADYPEIPSCCDMHRYCPSCICDYRRHITDNRRIGTGIDRNILQLEFRNFQSVARNSLAADTQKPTGPTDLTALFRHHFAAVRHNSATHHAQCRPGRCYHSRRDRNKVSVRVKDDFSLKKSLKMAIMEIFR